MTRSLRTVWLCMMVAVGGVGLASVQRTDPGPVAATLQQLLADWAAAPAHHGVSAAVFFADGRRWTGAAGVSTATEVIRTDHHFVCASIVKTMVGALILRLADAGTLSLEDPVNRWLPPIPNVAGTITIRQLLNHTGGLANYSLSAGLARAIAEDPSRRWTAQELLTFIDVPLSPPGAITHYSNSGTLLLSMVAEKVHGEPVHRLFRRELFVPQGITDVFMPFVEAPTGPMAMSWTPAGPVNPLTRVAAFSAGRTVFATAEAIARWGQALFAGTVVSTAMQAQMRTLVPAAGTIPGESGVGLGIRSYQYLGRVQYGHSGGAGLGASLLLHDPTTGVTVAVMTNQGANADHFLLAPELLRVATTARGPI